MQESLTNTGEESLGAALRQWRNAAGLSLSQLADRAGVAKSSVSVWERGIHSPRIPELTAVLTALGVGGREAQIALSHIPAPRAAAEQTLLIRSAALNLDFAPTPGRLLQSIRQRRGLSLRRLAHAIGRTPPELARWETKGARPSADALTALLTHLQPEEAEAQWLRERFSRVAPPHSREGATLDALAAALEGLKGMVAAGHHAALDLEFLLWEMQVCGWLFVRREAAAELLRRGRSVYAYWLTWDGRLAEANDYAVSAMALSAWGSASSLAQWFDAAAHVRASFEARHPRRKRPRRAVELLHGWLTLSDAPVHQSSLLREIAHFAKEAGEAGYAEKASERALRSAYETGDENFIRSARIVRTETMTGLGDYREALRLLSEEDRAAGAMPAFETIMQSFRWAELMTAMGDCGGADTFLRQIHAGMERYGYATPTLYQRAENVARDIERMTRRPC